MPPLQITSAMAHQQQQPDEPPLEPGIHAWHVFENPTTMLPYQWQHGTRVNLTQARWISLVVPQLKSIIDTFTTIQGANAIVKWDRYTVGQGIPEAGNPMPSPGFNLPGRCIIAQGFKSYLHTHQEFSFLEFHPVKGAKRGVNEGYFWVKPNAIMPNSAGIGLHTLLRWMYSGPNEGLHALDTAHCCHHRQCLAPWHYAFVTSAVNNKGTWNKKKRRKIAGRQVART